LIAHDCLNPNLEECTLPSNCVEVGELAFAQHGMLRSVVFPEGLKRIGDSAFFNCGRLVHVELPSTLVHIGARAFRETRVAEFVVAPTVETIGECAFSTVRYTPASREMDWHSSALVRIDGDNPHFKIDHGVLYRLDAQGVPWQVMQYVGPDVDVNILAGATEVGPIAFGGVRGLKSLVVPSTVRKIKPSGFALCEVPEYVEVKLPTPVDGRDSVVVHPVNDFYSLRAWTAAYADGIVNPFELINSFDRAAMSTPDFFDRSRYIISRLADPYHLREGLGDYFAQEVRRDMVVIFDLFCKHDYRIGFDHLFAAGMLDAKGLSAALETASEQENVAMSAYLLELKRRVFPASDNDYEL